jgi:hypothetical protein
MGHAVFVVVHVAVLVLYPPAIVATLLLHGFIAANDEPLRDPDGAQGD